MDLHANPRFVAFLLAMLLFLPAAVSAQEPPKTRPVDYTSPVISADGSLLFFIGDGPGIDNLHFARADGSDERRLTHEGATLPRWIGNPGMITFAGIGTSPDSGRVFAMNPDGTNRRLIASIRGRSPVLSPDGTRVAYLVGPWRAAEIWVANIDSTGARRVAGGLVSDGQVTGGQVVGGQAASGQPIGGQLSSAWNPAWSPDGSRIAYTYGDSTRRLQIHIVKVVGSVRDTAVTDTLEHRIASQVPAWSPDGRKLAMQWSTESGRGSRIAVIDLPTRSMHVIDIPPPEGIDSVRDEVPSWFPDSKRIAFQSNRSKNVDIWVVNEDGTGLTQVTGVSRR